MNLVATIFIAVLMLYIFSFGPGLFILCKSEKYWNNHSRLVQMASGVVAVLYFPHIYTMALFEPYYDYGKWWVESGGQKVNLDYSGFKRRVMG